MGSALADKPRFPRQAKGRTITGSHYALLVGVVWFDGAGAKAATLVLVGLISFFAWIGAVRRWRVAADIPSSKIRSAAQGYVELVGVARAADAAVLKDPIGDEACVCFRVETWERSGDRHEAWHLLKSAESSRAFVVHDATGTCEVMPQGAEFTIGAPEIYRDGEDLEHRVWRIRTGDSLCVTGDFATIDETSVIRAPADGRPYLISTRVGAEDGAGYHGWAWVHLAFVFVGLAAFCWLLAR